MPYATSSFPSERTAPWPDCQHTEAHNVDTVGGGPISAARQTYGAGAGRVVAGDGCAYAGAVLTLVGAPQAVLYA